MQTGFVLCTSELDRIVCLTPDKNGFQLETIDNTLVLNRALCFHNRTEAKNILTRIESHLDRELDIEIKNIALLYKKFYG
jgi:hypothetical protein